MHHRHVLVVEEFPTVQDTRLWQEVSASGFEIVRVPLEATAETVRNGLRPEAVILNMAAAEMAGVESRYRDAAERLVAMQGRSRLPVIAIGSQVEADFPAGVSEIVSGSRSPSLIARRISSLARLANMQAELTRRLATDAEFGLPHGEDHLLGGSGAKVLVVSEPGRFTAIEDAIERFGEVVGAMTRQMALDFLTRATFGTVVLALPEAEAHDLVLELRHHPSHFDLPVVVVSDGGDVESFYRAGAHDVIDARSMRTDLVRAVRGLMAEEHLRTLLREGYRAARTAATNDPLTGAFTSGYLSRHIERCIADATATGEDFALVGFAVSASEIDEADAVIAPQDQVTRQIGRMMARICRAEDLVARHEDGFVVLMPGTHADDAVAPAQRIASIVRSTRLVLDDGTHVQAQLLPRIVALDPELSVGEHLSHFTD